MADKVFRVISTPECTACQEKFGFDSYVRGADKENVRERLGYLKFPCPRCKDGLPKFFPEGHIYMEEIEPYRLTGDETVL